MIGPHHQYPDGAVLFLGTMFAPIEDRDAPGKGFTHKVGDIVAVAAPRLGRLVNRMRLTDECEPWTFGDGRADAQSRPPRALVKRVRRPDMTFQAKNFIAGEWVGAGDAAPDINPSNTGDVVGEFPRGNRADAERAIAAAKDAFPAWSRSTPQVRHDLLKRIGDEILARKDELGRLLSREEGKTLAEGVGESVRAGQIFLFFSGETLRLAGEKVASVRPSRRRGGDAGAVGRRGADHAVELSDRHSRPGRSRRRWPTAIAWCSSPPTSSPRPPTRCPRSSPAPACRRASSTWSWAGARRSAQAILEHPDVTAVSFTGSVATGRRVAAACVASDPMKKVQLEMGGKNPLVVLDDADLGVAVDCAVNGAFFSTGQRCTASSRLIVTAGIHDRFVVGGDGAPEDRGGGRRPQARHADRSGGGRCTARPSTSSSAAG